MAIVADLSSGKPSVYTASAHQYDTGQKLIITGVELPETYEVHISNAKTAGMASSYMGNPDGVLIPDAFFLSGEYIYIWIYMTAEEHVSSGSQDDGNNEGTSEIEDVTINTGKTLYEIIVPIIKRAGKLPVK